MGQNQKTRKFHYSFHHVSSSFTRSFSVQTQIVRLPKKAVTHLKTATNSAFSQLSFSAAKVTTSTWRGDSQRMLGGKWEAPRRFQKLRHIW